ncbi:DUF1127 domain-containing protein [Martelella alba]|uniref:DUF1127 domain-containing protein n=1 Tax=Martelella alba TaxID=2590451 RepID=A0A506U4V3_9HYPH|nr:DUF1127 domain-containing protein [Martelella alba]TPW29413.1 DUF1127 domain-containing protein [Martelella alba]
MMMVRSFSNWLKYRQAVSQLSHLNARKLADVGIAPAEIRAVARKACF